MKILPVLNYQTKNKTQTKFGSLNEEGQAVCNQIIRDMTRIKASPTSPNALYNAGLLEVLKDLYSDLISQRSALLKNYRSMFEFASNITCVITDAVKLKDTKIAKDGLAFLKALSIRLERKKVLVISEETFRDLKQIISDVENGP